METQTEIEISNSIHAETQLGVVALTVGNLKNQLDFYQRVMGFELQSEGAGDALLSAGGKPLLVLRELAGAPRSPQRATGLYHFAILLPSRPALAQWLLHLAQSQYPLGGASDHLVSEALYLSDPEGNGIEVYRDRPRGEWVYQLGQVAMATEALDLQALIDEALADPQPWNGLAAGTTLGHMHLQVGDIPQARAFYNGILGFDVVVDMERMGALFVSAGGYHHHIGLNTWQSRGRGKAPEGSAGLSYFGVLLPNEEALQWVLARLDKAGILYSEEMGGMVVEDPWSNRILLLKGTNQ